MRDFVSIHYNGYMAFVTIDNPASLNALSHVVLHQLKDVVSEISNNDAVRIVVFTGSGRSFVAGADISEMIDMTPEKAFEYSKLGIDTFQEIEKLDKVTIAAINGYALGGGCELAMSCDFRIASDNAMFGQPEVKLGIIPGFLGIRRMKELVGVSKAKELVFSGTIIDVFEAERIGLVDKIVNADSLIDECVKMAELIAASSYNAVRIAKRVFCSISEGDGEWEEFQSNCFADCFRHKDQAIGMTSFLNKRKPSR